MRVLVWVTAIIGGGSVGCLIAAAVLYVLRAQGVIA